MFDDVKQPSSTTPVNNPTANSSVKPTATEKIYTMPMEYYLGEKTVGATRINKTVQINPVVAPTASIITPTIPGKQAAAAAGPKKKIWMLVTGIIILAVAGSTWLLIKSFEPPAAPARLTPAEQPAAVNNTAPVVTPVVQDNATQNNPTTFNPADLKQFSLSLMASLDTDKDGLTDSEEKIFGTDPNLKDTDGDGYLDGEEVANFYSPLDKGMVRLWDKSFAKWYEHGLYGYKFLYPGTWTVKPLDAAEPKEIMVMTDGNEFINILQDTKSAGQTLDEWYLQQAPTVAASDLKHYDTFNKLPVLESPDGFTVYIAQGNTVFILNYNIGIAEEANYPAIFGMVVNSFQFTNAVNAQ